METPYNLIPDRPKDPRDRLQSYEVRREQVVVDLHDVCQFETTPEQPPQAQTTKFNGENLSTQGQVAASPSGAANIGQSEERLADSESRGISIPHIPRYLPSSPSRSILKKSGIEESPGNQMSNGTTEQDSEVHVDSTPSNTHMHDQLNGVSKVTERDSRRQSKVTFAALNPLSDQNADDNQDNADHPTEHEPSIQLLGNGKPRGVSLSQSIRNLVRSKPRPHHHKKLQRLQSHLSLDGLSMNELELKANLFYHIGNPIKRWKVERVVPIKLILQILKTFCLAVQLILFTVTVPHTRAVFFFETREVFENLFLQNFTQQEDARDIYTAFSAQQMFSEFDFITQRYFRLPNITIGGYDFPSNEDPPQVKMDLYQYTRAEINPTTKTYTVDGTLNRTTFYIEQGQNASEVYIENSGDELFTRFVKLIVSFQISNIRIVHPERVECFLFTVTITFKSDDNSGKVLYFLRENHAKEQCNGEILTPRNTYYVVYALLTILDVGIIIMCTLSIILTWKTLHRGVKLGKAMGAFYKNMLKIKLSWWERRALFPAWHALNTFSDVIIIFGTFYKILLDFNVTFVESPTRVLLGTAIIVQALVILRYVAYFKQLNALTRTLALALPELGKFLLCAVILFLAFAITGWIILGPYHSKFHTINDTIETLFGLLNGDDIYNTYTMIDVDDDPVAYAYSRIYLYVFLSLFIYAVLNLFTSLVIVAYEASKNYDTATENEVRRFVFSGPLTPNGVALRDVTLTKKYVDPKIVKERVKKNSK